MFKNLYLNLASVVAMVAVAYFTSASWIEITAAVTGLLCVWLNAKENIWNYPIGYINVACFMWMFWDAKLYADFTLQIFFAVLMAIGWYTWLTKRQGNAVRPTKKIDGIHFGLIVLSILILGGLWGLALHAWTDASIPYLDATIAMASIMAQFLLSRKILQNWLIWIVVDVFSIGMYWYKGLHLTAYLYVMFLLIAIQGYVEWRRNYEIRVSARKVSAAARRS